mgnify:CR=1 FL=1
MRRWNVLAALVLAAGVGGTARPAQALSQGEEAGLAVLAACANLWYVPAKLVVSAVSLPAGALAGWLSGGDVRTAYGLWVPGVGGDWFLTVDHLDGSRPLEFFGADYADRPSTRPDAVTTDTYNARYESSAR